MSLSREPAAGPRDSLTLGFHRDQARLRHSGKAPDRESMLPMPSELQSVPAQGPGSCVASTQGPPHYSAATTRPPSVLRDRDTRADLKAAKLKWLSDCVIRYHQKESLLWERDLVMECSSPERLCLRDLQAPGSFQACQQLEFSCSSGWLLNAKNCSTLLSPSPAAEKCYLRAVTRLRRFRREGTNTPGPVVSSLGNRLTEDPCI